jgi:hypothetical protein
MIIRLRQHECMTQISNELVIELLKKVQTDVKEVLGSHTRRFLRVREDLNSLRETSIICAATTCAAKPCRLDGHPPATHRNPAQFERRGVKAVAARPRIRKAEVGTCSQAACRVALWSWTHTRNCS